MLFRSYSIDKETSIAESTESKLELVKKSFIEKGYEVCFVETSTKELNELGFCSIAAFSPEMQPLYLDESIPYHGGKRLSEVPSKLGYTSASRFNTVPHPFS